VKPAALAALGTILSLAACSGREPPRQGGIVVVTAKSGVLPAKLAPPRSATIVALPLPASAALEAAIPATTELAALAIEHEVGVLVTAQKARDPFRMADIDLSDVQDAPTAD
jgi:hypothetical protein